MFNLLTTKTIWRQIHCFAIKMFSGEGVSHPILPPPLETALILDKSWLWFHSFAVEINQMGFTRHGSSRGSWGCVCVWCHFTYSLFLSRNSTSKCELKEDLGTQLFFFHFLSSGTCWGLAWKGRRMSNVRDGAQWRTDQDWVGVGCYWSNIKHFSRQLIFPQKLLARGGGRGSEKIPGHTIFQ